MSVLLRCPRCYKPVTVTFFASTWDCPWCQAHGSVYADKAEDGLRLKVVEDGLT